MNTDQPLSFLREAETYLATEFASPDLEARDSIAHQISAYTGQRIVSAIPCYALEQPRLPALASHVNHIGKVGGHVVVLINADAPTLQSDLDKLASKICSYLSRYCRVNDFSVVSENFGNSYPIGRIRAILCDAIVSRALRFLVDDLIIVSNDIDCCFTPDNYGQIVGERFCDPCLDILSGPLFYGYSPNGDDYIGVEPAAPDLFLGNRILEARRLSRLNGHFYGSRFFTTEGPHTAFRASAYCAADGYDVSLEQAEDDELGIAIFSLRQQGAIPFPQARNAIFDPAFWLVTNPRRQLLAIADGVSIIDTWLRFPIKSRSGHEISSVSTAHQNQQRAGAVSVEELHKFARSPRTCDAAWQKILEIFLLGLGDRTLSSASLEYYLMTCGVEIVDAGSGYDALSLARRSRPSPAFTAALFRFLENRYPFRCEEKNNETCGTH
ncbi:hypothetical protein DXT91_24355 [Agrobacterium tumefaciens]|uniref:hypothetical protein n=1 Tax=Agrobacterium tumefaciens TaxID=358 RepID=UPI0012BA0CAA|nr:hypothetical protein [Agrobacterium tumefaciens]MQB07217.1 hypothetical protein [Agrobacterium tumefaciens]